MSTKFSSLSKVQKPPAVCKKQPPPEQVPPPDFVDRFFQGFGSVLLTDISGTIQIAGPFTMLPFVADNNWAGEYVGNIHRIVLLMRRNLPALDYHFTLTLWRGITVVGQWSLENVEPRSPDPLASGYLNFTPDTDNENVFAQVYS